MSIGSQDLDAVPFTSLMLGAQYHSPCVFSSTDSPYRYLELPRTISLLVAYPPIGLDT